jgi:hypothetical protein
MSTVNAESYLMGYLTYFRNLTQQISNINAAVYPESVEESLNSLKRLDYE